MFNAYVDYTPSYVVDAINKYGYDRFTQMNFQLQGIDIPNLTEKTAGQITNSCLTTHFLARKYLQNTLDNLKEVLR